MSKKTAVRLFDPAIARMVNVIVPEGCTVPRSEVLKTDELSKLKSWLLAKFPETPIREEECPGPQSTN